MNVQWLILAGLGIALLLILAWDATWHPWKTRRQRLRDRATIRKEAAE